MWPFAPSHLWPLPVSTAGPMKAQFAFCHLWVFALLLFPQLAASLFDASFLTYSFKTLIRGCLLSIPSVPTVFLCHIHPHYST